MIRVLYEAKELDPEKEEWIETTREFKDTQEDVEQIVPQDNKVGIHLTGTTLLVPFNRVYELEIELDEETVQKVSGGQEE